jgi:coenzyme F420-0:L-glutamate ligase / coenzyme F420-1:gamma-L-glutamate ligase
VTHQTTLTPAEAALVAHGRAARLATADAEGHPTVVPVCYAFDGERFYIALDEKPKSVDARKLARVRNIETRGEAALLVDEYAEDWSRLGYVLVHARAEIAEPGSADWEHALPLLRERYPQYRAMQLEALPVIVLTPSRVRSWGPALAGSMEPDDTESGRGMDFLPLARGRRSVRRFRDRPVPRAALEAMLDAARWAPSPHGRQPWRFAVLTRPERKAALAEAMGDEWRRTLEMDGEPAEVIEKRLDTSQLRIREAPALVLACLYLEELDRYPDPDRQRGEEVMAIQSLGAAIQNLLLEGYAQGLDCGWMCAPLFVPDIVRAALDLDAALIPHALIAVGYAAQEPKRRPHRPADELVVLFD